jgi:hypothetical protein
MRAGDDLFRGAPTVRGDIELGDQVRVAGEAVGDRSADLPAGPVSGLPFSIIRNTGCDRDPQLTPRRPGMQ